ncbi:probable serine/threonine-protein kinase cdc7 [Sitodiplosis mosellana]|uniref:probable serine/threonine-protein kinase cdc7 n=1 Tax=Sitodiplosis mosellana TaxID=263140 RepID=UPI002444ED5A|nr:probable serine/threonine-protein kinase cdc7 [Sitodiplosis mosellana]
MSNEPHCCESKNCMGSRYNGWSLNCIFCHKKIYVECLRNRDAQRTKGMLIKFGLMEKITEENGTISWNIQNDTNKLSEFYSTFNVDSPFGLTCEFCKLKFSQQLPTENENRNSHQSAETSKNQQKNIETPQISPVNGVYAIHVSRMPKETTTDDVAALIIVLPVETDAMKKKRQNPKPQQNVQRQVNSNRNHRNNNNYNNRNIYETHQNNHIDRRRLVNGNGRRRHEYRPQYRERQIPVNNFRHHQQQPLQQLPINPQFLPNSNYSFWNGTPYHIMPPQMYTHNTMPIQMIQPLHTHPMYQPF